MDNERDALDRIASPLPWNKRGDKAAIHTVGDHVWGTQEAAEAPLDLTDPNDKQWHIECEEL